jgi:hypothetical protein
MMGLGVAAILAMGCERPECGCPGDQPVYFQYRYVNYAWGYQERGWLIDNQGKVRYFESPEGFRLPDSTGLISWEDMKYNLALTDSVITTVGEEELNEYIAYIPAAAAGEIGPKNNIAADAGGSVLSCYLYDQEADAYRYVFLAMSGDWEQFNLSAEAGILVEWLIEFGVFWLSE